MKFSVHLKMEKPIGDQIRDARKLKGWSQKQLSEATNVHKDTISSIESGRSKGVTLCTLQLLGEKLEIKFEI